MSSSPAIERPARSPIALNTGMLSIDDEALHAFLDGLQKDSTGAKESEEDALRVRAQRVHSILQERGVVDGGGFVWEKEDEVGAWALGVLEGMVGGGLSLGLGLSLHGGGVEGKGMRSLRERLEKVERELDRRIGEVERLKDKLRKKEGRVWELERGVKEAGESEVQLSREYRKDITALRVRIAKLEQREGFLMVDKTKREKEVAKLKTRLHQALRKGGRKAAIKMTHKIKAWENEDETQMEEDSHSFYEMISSSYEESKRQLMAENEDFRNLLRSVQEELDDIVIQCHEVASAPSPKRNNQDSPDPHPCSPVELPEPAIDAARMELPYEIVREEFETSLEEKLTLIRKTLETLYSSKALGFVQRAASSHQTCESEARDCSTQAAEANRAGLPLHNEPQISLLSLESNK